MAAPPSILTSDFMKQAQFQQELESMLSMFNRYENKFYQAAAVAEVPVEYLTAVAQAKFDSSYKPRIEHNEMDKTSIVRDMFLLELMTWFKTEFFSWMDTPFCPTCTTPTVAIGYGTPTFEESAGAASRVEIFTCNQCFGDGREVTRFPRYNDPMVLLKTRRGRCGEWANCFALICRAVGFEVRYVRDWTDHVWVEVFSCGLKLNRWVHTDPCENSYDNPLLYEKGWGKKLSYVIAVTQDDIQDVTWRYVERQNNHIQEVVSRRRLLDENTVVKTIIRIRERQQASIPLDRKSILKLRLIQELVEFLSPHSDHVLHDSELVGRDSGSLAWRLARQELGTDDDCLAKKFVWKISDDKICNSKFHLSYDCATDQYVVQTKNAIKHVAAQGWANGIYESKNIFRKEETDWKMVYLARKENSIGQNGSVSWRFEVSDPNLRICAVNIAMLAAIFHPSAKVLINLADEKGTKLLDSNCVNGVFNWDSNKHNSAGSILSSKILTITCELQGGEGNTAWQHAQLFRQPKFQSPNSPTGMCVVIEISSHSIVK